MLSTELPPSPSGQAFIDQPRSPSPNQNLVPLSAEINAQGHLEIGGCDVPALVEKFGSPLYILDETTLRAACGQYRDAFKAYYPGPSQVIYASKAWSCLAVCAVVAQEDLGFDVVSGGELYTTLRTLGQMGWNTAEAASKIYFHGNNKSRQELEEALAVGCVIIVDNWLELETLARLGAERPEAPIPILLRLTPGIECHTHDYIRTGHLDSKFGFDPQQLDAVFTFVAQQSQFHCLGLHAHIGSQIFERQPHQDLGDVLADWFEKGLGHGLPLEILNIGGGLGIRYTEQDDPPSIEEWVKAVSEAVVKACEKRRLALPKLMAEPGRSLIGTACVTAYRVGGKKVVPGIRTYLAVDGGMSDNPRPITYQSLYRAILANKATAPTAEPVTLAGKHCESGDILIHDLPLPAAEPGDIVTVFATGAYNYSMASNYNRLPRPAAVLVKDGEANLILKRESYSDLIRQDCLPHRLLK
ncbi:MAG: diaminopimelate decarboxylase [Cyanobacteria bacterium RI_101]|nr:diaminopimelate decarboxylase [Cyanobacteria bacterium RI_101]